MTDDALQLKRRVYLLAICQGLYLTAAVLSVTVAALVGEALAPQSWMATVPYGAQFGTIVVFAYPAARLVARIGRRWSFALGAGAAVGSGAVGYAAVVNGSFPGLVLSHVLLGVFVTHANFYRFAATDGIQGDLKARAVSLVTAGGVFAGLVAPPMANVLRGLDQGATAFAPTYGLFAAIGALTMLAVAALPRHMGRQSGRRPEGSSVRAETAGWMSHAAGFAVAVYCAGVGYLIMNLLMIQSTLALAAVDVPFWLIATGIQIHVMCMFVPSFFTGGLIAATGHRRILLIGLGLLALSGTVGSLGGRPVNVIPALALLGVAWNFLFVGGTAYLTECYDEHQRYRAQGLNDTAVSVLAAIGAFTAGLLFESAGWQGSNLLALPIAAVGAFLVSRIVEPPGRMLSSAYEVAGRAGR